MNERGNRGKPGVVYEDGCSIPDWGGCCCNCAWHLQDNHHCCTTRPEGMPNCVCSEPKGWICAAPEMERIHSGWPKHSYCECHTELKESEKVVLRIITKKDV